MLIFEKHFVTSTQIVNRYKHNVVRRRKVFFENEHHTRVLEIRFAPRSRFERLRAEIKHFVTSTRIVQI